jgi:hypothetical protein
MQQGGTVTSQIHYSPLPAWGPELIHDFLSHVVHLKIATMPRKTYLKIKAQADEHRIFFIQDKNSRVNVPDDHQEKFEIIQDLGHTLYDLYIPHPDIDTPDKPWKRKNAQKALRLVHESNLCRKDNLNEAGWREPIESAVYERFKIEVAW